MRQLVEPPNPKKPTALRGAAGVWNRQSGNRIRGCDGARIHAADSLARVDSQSVTKAAALFPFFPLPLLCQIRPSCAADVRRVLAEDGFLDEGLKPQSRRALRPVIPDDFPTFALCRLNLMASEGALAYCAKEK